MGVDESPRKAIDKLEAFSHVVGKESNPTELFDAGVYTTLLQSNGVSIVCPVNISARFSTPESMTQAENGL